MAFVLALIALWLLLVLLAALQTREADGSFSLFAFLFFVLGGGFSLLVNLLEWLAEIEI